MPRYDDLPFAPLPGRGAAEEQFMQAIEHNVMTKLRVCVPATVTAWTPAVPGQTPATVDLLLDFKRVRAIDNPGEVRADQGETLVTTPTGLLAVGPRPMYRKKPIVYPSAGPAFSLRGPIAVGTTGLYIIADRCIDQWLNTGGPVDPATADKHDLNDGFFLPLVYHGANTAVIPQDKHQLGPDDGTAGLEIALADKSITMRTDGPTANVDAATQVQLGDPLSALLGVARLNDKTTADTTMTIFIAQVVAQSAVLAGLGFGVAATAPTDFGFVSQASNKVVAQG